MVGWLVGAGVLLTRDQNIVFGWSGREGGSSYM